MSTTYDIIITGGGVAGCVIAGRSSAADPSLKILILEAGPHCLNLPTHIQPARYYNNLTQPSTIRKTLTLHTAKPNEALLGRSIVVPAGRALGGGSSIHFMAYTRASASDYDAWEQQFGNEGWGSKDLIPLLKQVETFQPYGTSPQEPIEVGSVHGDSGPIKVSFQTEHINLAKQYLDVAKQYDKARVVGEDFNDFGSGDKYAMWGKYIDPKTGRRSDAAHAFIYNLPHNPNLVIQTETRVVRVLFEGTKAVGVEYIDGTKKPANGTTMLNQAFASRLVVLSAGTFGSPAILERSGIGRADVLKENKVPQLVDLPGVGEHYMDHNLIFTHYHSSDEAETVDSVFYGEADELAVHEAEWERSGKGLLAHNGLNAGSKFRPTPDDLTELEPFQERWKSFFENAPDKPVMLGGLIAAYCGHLRPASLGKAFNMLYCSMYPASLGYVHIADGADPYTPLNYHSGYFDDEGDVSLFRWAYKHCREIARRMPFYRGELIEWHPTFTEGSEVACNPTALPVPVDAPKLRYTKEDDEAIDDFHRRTLTTAWHAAGTCAMKARAVGGVVDSKLNVYGTTNLKVTDLSIIPENVGANTCNTALAIGMKATLIIADELGVTLKP